MSITPLEAHTSDTAIPFTITPSFDIENSYILCFVYDLKTKQYIGRVNAVNPYQEFPKLEFTITGGSQGSDPAIGDQFNSEVILSGYRNGVVDIVDTINVSGLVEQNAQTITFNYDPKDFVNVFIKDIKNGQDKVTLQDENFSLIDPVFSTATGVVVAGPVGQSFPFFCDFTKIPAGVYSIVWVATPDSDFVDGFQGSGVIGKDILILKSNDGF
mgnify:CR=1 FL=1